MRHDGYYEIEWCPRRLWTAGVGWVVVLMSALDHLGVGPLGLIAGQGTLPLETARDSGGGEAGGVCGAGGTGAGGGIEAVV